MELVLGMLLIATAYIWVLFMDRFFKSCSHYAYIQFLKGTGLEISILQFTWTTTAFNRMLVRWGSIRPKLLNLWFNFGLCTSLVLFPIAICLLFVAFVQNFVLPKNSKPIIEPAVPGINFPASEMGYYSLTLLVASVIHELGHALAAVQEDVTLINVGANVLFILPVAFVNISSDKLFSLTPWKRLKILCAGVWHNFVLALVVYLLYISLHGAFSPFFTIGKGVVVSEITQRSPLSGSRGLNIGDTIISINDCTVTDEDSWYNCLRALQNNKPAFCIEADLVHNLDESVHLKHLDNGLVSCCHVDNKGKLCFEYLDNEDGILEFPPYVCLPGRTVIEVSRNYCMFHPHTCPKDTFCFRPVLSNSTGLFKIKRLKHLDVIYTGLASDVARTITVSSYVPKYDFLTSKIPDVITKFLGYVVVFSLGLAVVNILPCVFMDGQHITTALFHLFFSKHLRTTQIKVLSAVVTVSFTLLLAVHCIITIGKKLNL